MAQVQAAATRKILPGKEAEFEAAIVDFIQRSLDFPGTVGAHLIKPAPGSQDREYGILRSFESEEALEAFYASDLFKDWHEASAQYASDDYEIRRLHGLEAFFRGDLHRPPPRWKMAVVTWCGVFPAVYLWSLVLRPYLSWAPMFLAIAITTALVVVTLTWGVMPFLTRVLRPWLHGAGAK